MPTEFGIAVTAWTARIAVGCYLARFLIDMARPRDVVWQARGRRIWTIGWIVFCLHVLAAYHFYHHWSRAAAWEHTREQTLLKTGWDSGVGLFVNDLFLLVWLVDLVLWWRDINRPQQRGWYVPTQSFLLFIVINATVVFGPPGWIPVAIGVMIAAGVLKFWRRSTRPLSGKSL
ncbi:hypothetical protein GC163_02165 [bacterium]|nr:hypothetical protein [bacterium]